METSRKTTDELLELLKQKKSFDEYLQEGPEFVEISLRTARLPSTWLRVR